MRVLQVMECTIGGTRRHLRDLSHGLARAGVEVEVCCAALREPRMRADMQAMRAAGMRVHELPMVRAITPRRDAWHALRLARLVVDRGFDVIHTHSSKAGALGRLVAWLGSGAARVHTPHTYAVAFEGGHGQGGEAAGPRALILGTERLLGRVTRRLIHVSAAELEQGRELGIVRGERGVVVPNGIDPAPFAEPVGGAELRAELGIPADAPVVGSVGLLNDAKGHDGLLEAARAWPADVHVLLVGHGERERALRDQAAAAGLAERVHFAGWREDVLACYAAMDVFVLSSRWEGMAYALLEAMASGRACVSTDVNGSAEALGTADPASACGVIVPREDPPALATAVAELLADEARRVRFGREARARVARSFSVDAMVAATLDVYHEALGA